MAAQKDRVMALSEWEDRWQEGRIGFHQPHIHQQVALLLYLIVLYMISGFVCGLCRYYQHHHHGGTVRDAVLVPGWVNGSGGFSGPLRSRIGLSEMYRFDGKKC